MALGITFVDMDVSGKLVKRYWDLTLDSSYPAGGYPLTPAMMGFGLMWGIKFIGGNAAGSLLRPAWDNVNQKLVIGEGAPSVFTYDPGTIKGSANTDSENVDSASAPTESTYISTAATFTTIGEGGTLVLAHQPDVSRNVMITILNDTGGNLNLFQGVTTFAVVGTFRGVAQTENITFTSTSGNKAVAPAPDYRYKYGVKPFDTITSITVTNIGAGTLKVTAGLGSKLGLPRSPNPAVDASMLKVTVNAADLPVAGITDFTNQTVNVGAVSDNATVDIEYLTGGTGASFAGAIVRGVAIGS